MRSDTTIEVRLATRYREFGLVMVFKGYAPEMVQLQPDGYSYFSSLLYKSSLAALGVWVLWEKISPSAWAIRQDEIELLGITPDLEACAGAVRECFAAAGVRATVEIAD